MYASDAGSSSSVVAVTDEEEDMDWGKRGKQLQALVSMVGRASSPSAVLPFSLSLSFPRLRFFVSAFVAFPLFLLSYLSLSFVGWLLAGSSSGVH